MGGDQAPFKTLKGVEIFLKKNSDVNFLIYGNQKLIDENINTKKLKLNNYEIINTENDVTNDDSPNTILRNRKNSSIFRGLESVKNSSI